jgi:hypothetical protein
MPTDNEWLRLIYAQLSQAGTGGSSITPAQVQQAIEASTNLDQVEPLLGAIASGLLTPAQVKTAIESATNLDQIETLLAAIASSPLTAQVQQAIEQSANLDQLEALLAAIGSNTSTPLTVLQVQGAIEQASNLALVQTQLDSIYNAIAAIQPGSDWRSIPNPSAVAAGNGYDFTVPARTEWQVQQVTGKLVTGAAAANRSVIVEIFDGTSGALTIPFASSLFQAANLTYFWCFGSRSDTAAPLLVGSVGSVIGVAMTPLILRAGDKVRIIPANFQAGDTFTPYLKVMSRPV